MRAEDPLIGRIRWLIALRWLAVAMLFLVISAARFVARLDLPLRPLYAGNLLLAVLNGIYLLLLLKSFQSSIRATALANVQISLDLLLLTYLIHYSGGMANPFVFFFIFHMVIASILLSNRAAYFQATLAAAALALNTVGEQLGFLQSYSLGEFAPLRAGFSVWPGLVTRWSVLTATLFITVYVSTTIVNVLRRREEELEKLNLKLEESDRVKSRYVLTVSHEIRGPLAAIQSLLRVVRDGFVEPVPVKARELIERAELRSQELLSYVRDLLDLSSMRATVEVVRSPLNLSELVARAVAQYQSLLEQKDLTVSFEDRAENATLCADPEGLQHMIENLLDNAIRYTPAGGRITIGLEDDTGWLRLIVRDTGIGIRQEDLPRVFEDFYRARNAREHTKEGTGLGLPIVKQIVEAHGGRVEVESRQGAGSTFTVYFPRREAPTVSNLSSP
jgi:signal transduction histidine kinase